MVLRCFRLSKDLLKMILSKLELVSFIPNLLKTFVTVILLQRWLMRRKLMIFFKLNFLMLFSNTMGRCENMNGQICLDVVRHIPENLPISEIDWCGYIHNCLQYSTNPQGQCNYTGPLTVLMVSL